MTPNGPRPATKKQKEAQELIDKFAKDLRALNNGKAIPARWKTYLLKALTLKPERQKPGPPVDYEQVVEIVKRLTLVGDKIRQQRTQFHNPAAAKAKIAKDLGINLKRVNRIDAQRPDTFSDSELSRLDGLDPQQRQAIIEGIGEAAWVQGLEEEELERKATEEATRRRFPRRFPRKK